MRVTEIVEEARATRNWLAYRQAARKLRNVPDACARELPHRIKAAFLSSFTVEPVVDFTIVEAAATGIWVEPYVGGYGQFSQEILGISNGLDEFGPEITVLMVEFEALVDGVARRPPPNAGSQAAQDLVSLANAFMKRYKGTLVLSTFVAARHWPLHIVVDDSTRAVREANQLLLKACAAEPRVQICDLDALVSYYGRREALSPEMLSMARIPFSDGFLALLGQKIVSHLRAHRGMVRKCLVLDCDNTLWGGIIGEDGVDGIVLGPDAPGREYMDFQRAVLELHEEGVILAINSKNNSDDVMHVLRHHPHMILREQHFASIQANWRDKPSNMRQIADEISIGVDSLVFVDDSPTERAMMRAMLPEIYTLELPSNPSLYARALRETNEFAKSSVTEEDRMRGEAYAAQRKREELRRTAVTGEDFLRSLDTVVSIRLAQTGDVKRVAQLTQRTNQFNLTNRRYSEQEVAGLLLTEGAHVYVLGVKDRFGDNGTVGVAIVVAEDDAWRVETFVMSCRVIGRQAEEVLVNRIVKDAAARKVKCVRAEYVRSARNGLVADFWQRMEFERMSVNGEHSAWQTRVDAFRTRACDHIRCEEETMSTGA